MIQYYGQHSGCVSCPITMVMLVTMVQLVMTLASQESPQLLTNSKDFSFTCSLFVNMYYSPRLFAVPYVLKVIKIKHIVQLDALLEMLVKWEWGTGNRERGTGNGEQRMGNRKRGTGNGEWGTGNGEQGTGNREWGTANGERATGNGEQGMGNQNGEQGTVNREWGMGSEEQET